MPNLMVSDAETSDLIACILTLKEPSAPKGL
jgi:hypothetical protein